MTLSSLPSSYDNLIIGLEARPEDDLNFSFVESKLIEEYHRRRNKDQYTDSSESVLAVGKRNKSPIECYFCHKQGHTKKECVSFQNWLKRKYKSNGQKANNTNNDETEDSVQVAVTVENCVSFENLIIFVSSLDL